MSSTGQDPERSPLRTVALIAAGAVVTVVVLWLRHALGDTPLGWDESVYALRGRAHLDAAAPLTGWGLHRPPGLPVLSAGLQLLSGSDAVARGVGLLGALVAALSAAALVAPLQRSPSTCLLVVAAVVTTPVFLRGAGTGLSGVPSLALLLAGTAIWAHEVRGVREARPLRLLSAGVLLGTAFLVRYGVLLPVVVSALAPLAVRRLPITRRFLVAAGTASIGLGHALWSIDRTGSPVGILEDARRIAGTAAPAETIQHVLEDLTTELIGLPGLLLVVGALALLVVRRARPDVVEVTLLVMAVVEFVAAITSDEYEARFSLVPVTLVVLVAATVIGRQLTGIVAARDAAAAPVAIGALAVVVLILGARGAPQPGDDRFGDLRDAARLIAGEVADAPCLVGSSRVPQVTWWSGCETRPPDTVGDDGWIIDSPWDSGAVDPATDADLVIEISADVRIRRPVASR